MLPRLCGSEEEPECDDALIRLMLQEVLSLVLSLPPNFEKSNAQALSNLETCNAFETGNEMKG
jgi:hypothetical protein